VLHATGPGRAGFKVVRKLRTKGDGRGKGKPRVTTAKGSRWRNLVQMGGWGGGDGGNLEKLGRENRKIQKKALKEGLWVIEREGKKKQGDSKV